MITPDSTLWPPLDHEVSPLTGLTRDHWVASADEQLLAVRRFAGVGGIELPGPTSWSGERSDRLEGTARTFLLAAFRLGHEPSDDAHQHLTFYRHLLTMGARAGHAGSWPRAAEAGQAVVEAASIALGLFLTRDALWDHLSSDERGDLIGWLDETLDVKIPDNNWVLFRAVIAEFLRQSGSSKRAATAYLAVVDDALARIDAWYVGDGWYTDGWGARFDYYNAWALHFYPAFLVLMTAATRPAWSRTLRAKVSPRLSRFLEQHALFFGEDGAPVYFGRSLIYRQAALAALWAGELLACSPLTPGQTRALADRTLAFFRGVGAEPARAYDAEGILGIGWLGTFEPMRQPYSGACSPYWASKGYAGLLLPDSHAVWSEAEAIPPALQADVTRVLPSPGFVLSRTVADGIVRVVNHGSDNAPPLTDDDEAGYSRVAYSSATAPVYSGADIWDNHPTPIDAEGRSGRRVFFDRVETQHGLASSFCPVWSAPAPEDDEIRITTVSVVDGAYELRVHRVRQHSGRVVALREGGYAVAPAAHGDANADPSAAATDGLRSVVIPLLGYQESGRQSFSAASPYGDAVVPWCRGVVKDDATVFASLVVLDRGGAPLVVEQVDVTDEQVTVRVDGRTLTAQLP